MLRGAQYGGRRALMLAVLVTGLLAGLVAMHHLSGAGAGPHRTAVSMSTPDSAHAATPDADAAVELGAMQAVQLPVDRGDHGDSGLLHLCLAILTGVAVIVAAMPEWRRIVKAARPPLRASRPMPAPPAPPPSAPARLALLCVLRT